MPGGGMKGMFVGARSNTKRIIFRSIKGSLDRLPFVVLVAPGLIFLFELEDRFDRLPEGTCDLECEQGRGDELAAFDGIDRLAADADLFGQLLLGEADDGSLDTDVIFHGAGCGSVCKD